MPAQDGKHPVITILADETDEKHAHLIEEVRFLHFQDLEQRKGASRIIESITAYQIGLFLRIVRCNAKNLRYSALFMFGFCSRQGTCDTAVKIQKDCEVETAGVRNLRVISETQIAACFRLL